MDYKKMEKKIWPVIVVFLPMMLIYILICEHLQISVYLSFVNSSKTVMMENNNRQLTQRRILAEPLMLPQIPLENTVTMFRLYSVVPVRNQETFIGASLAIIGETAYDKKVPVTADDTYGKHFIKYNDHSVDQVFKVRKYTKVAHYGRETTWYAKMPNKVAKKMFNPDSARACASVTVLIGDNETTVNAVADFHVCHNPSVLPQPENKVDIAYCINTPPFFSLEIDYKEGNLSGGMAQVVPNLLYHLHSGVDLFVVYIPASIRQLYLQLLEPIIERYGHRLLFVDLGFKWRGKKFNPYRDNRPGNYDLQKPLSQDCLNRLKGHSRFFRTIDVDEYDMIFSHSKGDKFYTPKPLTFIREKNFTLAWNDENYKMPYVTYAMSKLRSDDPFIDSKSLFHNSHIKNFQTFDCLYLNHFWFIRQGMGNEKILPHTKSYIPYRTPKFGKCLCRPEKIAVTWVHLPSNCFQGKCKVKDINFPEDNKTIDNNNNESKKKRMKLIELGYAHIRECEWASNQKFMKKQKGNLIDTSLFNEVLKEIEDELVELYGTAVPADFLKAIK